MLVGLVKKNGIMMVDFAAAAERDEGKTPLEAIQRGLHGPVPADHDDDDVRAGRDAADRGRAGAPAPNHGVRWDSRWSAGCSCLNC